jgi:hypothetical protein
LISIGSAAPTLQDSPTTRRARQIHAALRRFYYPNISGTHTGVALSDSKNGECLCMPNTLPLTMNGITTSMSLNDIFLEILKGYPSKANFPYMRLFTSPNSDKAVWF